MVSEKENLQPKKMKRKSEEETIMKKIKKIEKDLTMPNEEDFDEDFLYCRSLVPTLKRLPPRQNRIAKIKISQLLFELEFGEEVS